MACCLTASSHYLNHVDFHNSLRLSDAYMHQKNKPIFGSDNDLSPGRHKATIWNNAGILLIGPLGANPSKILIEIYIFSFKKMHLKMLSGKCQPFCLNFNVLMRFCGIHLTTILQRVSKYDFKITATFPRGQWVKFLWQGSRNLWATTELLSK